MSTRSMKLTCAFHNVIIDKEGVNIDIIVQTPIRLTKHFQKVTTGLLLRHKIFEKFLRIILIIHLVRNHFRNFDLLMNYTFLPSFQ